MISVGRHLTILESVDSTNNYAMAKVRNGQAEHGDAFFAMSQFQGKGQRGKTWVTERGSNIIITLVLNIPRLQQLASFSLSMAIALAVHDFFSRNAGEETSIKWPNDIYWRDRKAGGILIENIIAGRADTSWSVAGMGININQTLFPEEIRNAVSLKQITGRDWDVIELAKQLCQDVESRWLQFSSGEALLEEYNQRLFKRGQTVKLKKESRVFEATIRRVNETGDLVAFTTMEETFRFGTIEWVIAL